MSTPKWYKNIPMWGKIVGAVAVMAGAIFSSGAKAMEYVDLPERVDANTAGVEQVKRTEDRVVRGLNAIQCHLQEDHEDSPNFAKCIPRPDSL